MNYNNYYFIINNIFFSLFFNLRDAYFLVRLKKLYNETTKISLRIQIYFFKLLLNLKVNDLDRKK